MLFGFTCSGKTRENPGRNKDSGNTHLGRNQGRRTEYIHLAGDSPYYNIIIYSWCYNVLNKMKMSEGIQNMVYKYTKIV